MPPSRAATQGLVGKVKEMTINRRKEVMGKIAVMAEVTNEEKTISNRKRQGDAYGIGM